MDANRGVIPGGRQVLRKAIVQRRYRSDFRADVSIGAYVGNQIHFHYVNNSKKPNINFVRYLFGEEYIVYATALYYLPGAGDVLQEWQNRSADGQWGHLLFTTHSANIRCVFWFGAGATTVLNGDWSEGPLIQLYPCISFRRQGPNNLIERRLCFGLMFGQTSAMGVVEDPRGRRRFVRGPIDALANIRNANVRKTKSDQYLHELGNVWEILDLTDILQDIPRSPPAQTRHTFAIYVCAGARLVVTDNHNCKRERNQTNLTATEYGHNRTLVQQGGLVVAEYELKWAPPPRFIHPLGVFKSLTTAEAVECGFLTPNNTNLEQKYIGIQEPVVFLGATESQHETHCWGLNIDVSGGQRRAILSAPQDGVVTAIEEWETGMREVTARFAYEQLHSSVVTDDNHQPITCCRDFNVPNGAGLLDKILGVGAHSNRWLAVNYSAPGIYQSGVPLAIQHTRRTHTPIKCLQHWVTRTNSYRPPVLPLRPAFAMPGDAADIVRFMPTTAAPESKWHRLGPDWYLNVDTGKYEKYTKSQHIVRMNECVMTKCGYNTPPAINGVGTYVGVDGWAYEEAPDPNGVAHFQYPVYRRNGTEYYTETGALYQPVPAGNGNQ